MKRGRFDIAAAAGAIGSALTERGCVFEWQMDNRGSTPSRYIFGRKPFAAKVRVADHPSDRWTKDAARSRIPMLDVNPRALTVEAAIDALEARLSRERQTEVKAPESPG